MQPSCTSPSSIGAPRCGQRASRATTSPSVRGARPRALHRRARAAGCRYILVRRGDSGPVGRWASRSRCGRRRRRVIAGGDRRGTRRRSRRWHRRGRARRRERDGRARATTTTPRRTQARCVFAAACTRPIRRAGPVVSPQSAAPLSAVGTAVSTPHATSWVAARRALRPPTRSRVNADVQNPMGRSVSSGCSGWPSHVPLRRSLAGCRSSASAHCIADRSRDPVEPLVDSEAFDCTREHLTEAHDG